MSKNSVQIRISFLGVDFDPASLPPELQAIKGVGNIKGQNPATRKHGSWSYVTVTEGYYSDLEEHAEILLGLLEPVSRKLQSVRGIEIKKIDVLIDNKYIEENDRLPPLFMSQRFIVFAAREGYVIDINLL